MFEPPKRASFSLQHIAMLDTLPAKVIASDTADDAERPVRMQQLEGRVNASGKRLAESKPGVRFKAFLALIGLITRISFIDGIVGAAPQIERDRLTG